MGRGFPRPARFGATGVVLRVSLLEIRRATLLDEGNARPARGGSPEHDWSDLARKGRSRKKKKRRGRDPRGDCLRGRVPGSAGESDRAFDAAGRGLARDQRARGGAEPRVRETGEGHGHVLAQHVRESAAVRLREVAVHGETKILTTTRIAFSHTNVMFRWLSRSHTSRLAYSSRHASSTATLCPLLTSSAVARSYETSLVPRASAQSRIAMYTAVIGSTFGPSSWSVSSRLTLDIFIRRRASLTSSSMTTSAHRRRASASDSRRMESNVRAVVYPIAFSPCSISSWRISAYADAM
mmetsp:Transcript_1489/g.6220  ORF Transcript_1489/g.6220 Transcript_1489/m.6220 type:complete len:296 (-) Transcript_1489:361-1248(-)